MALFSEMMRSARAGLGWSLTQLSSEVGFHPSYLSLVERGQRQLDEKGILRVAKALKLDVQAALIAALRERLPEAERQVLPESLAANEDDARLQAVRRFQRDHFDYEVERLRVQVSVDWDGNVRTVRTFEGCRPNAAGRPVWEIAFRERIVGAEPPADAPQAKFAVRQVPAGLEYHASSGTEGPWRQHRLFFPKGWRRSPEAIADSFSFVFETHQEKALPLDDATFIERSAREGLHNPLLRAYSFFLPYFLNRLEIAFDFPGDYAPERWEKWIWWGKGPLESDTRNLADAKLSRSLELQTRRGHAELLANEPVAGYTYSLVWIPASRQRYLEARYGGSHAP